MQTKAVSRFVCLMAAAVLTACASTGPGAEKSDTPADLAEQYSQKARILEDRGEIVQAAHFYKLAITVDPDNPRTISDLARVDKKRQQLAEQFYRKGTALYARGKYADSRRALLTALRLKPDHTDALNRLKARPRIAAKRFILHEIQPGETISVISDKYYGDAGKYAYIAQYNSLPDATRIRPGQELKIPEIEGLPFNVDKQTQEVKTEPEDPELPLWPAQDDGGDQGPTRESPVQHQAAAYQATGLDFLQAKKYDAAIVEFNKVLSAQPDNAAVKAHIFRAHYEWARDLMAQKKYIPAKQEFEKSLVFNRDCRKCHGFIQECETGYKEMHYQRGIQLFGAEKPDAAIAEWEKVRELDPDYKQVSLYIKKAKTISRNIEKLKQGE